MKSQGLGLGEFLKRYVGSELERIWFEEFLKILTALQINSFILMDPAQVFKMLQEEG